jgi:hypothetical protein
MLAMTLRQSITGARGGTYGTSPLYVSGGRSCLVSEEMSATAGKMPALLRYSRGAAFLRMAARSSATISCDALIAASCWFTLNEMAPTRA